MNSNDIVLADVSIPAITRRTNSSISSSYVYVLLSSTVTTTEVRLSTHNAPD